MTAKKQATADETMSVLEQESILAKARDDFGLFFLLITGDVLEMYPFTREMCGVIQKFTDMKYMGLVMAAGPRTGKLCSDSTPIFTPDGWRTHGEVKVGDYVFGLDGKPTKVVNINDFGPEVKADMLVTLSNGETIEVHHNHEWTVHEYDHETLRTYETHELQSKGLWVNEKGKRNSEPTFKLPIFEGIVGEHAELRLDPYILGEWLGDSTTVAPALNRLDNKHIPAEYLLASKEQRLQLLAGLIDTGGHCALEHSGNNSLEFSSSDLNLIRDVEHLLSSLGYRFQRTTIEPKERNHDIQQKHTYYKISFDAHDVLPTRVLRNNNVPSPRRKLSIVDIKEIPEEDREHGVCFTVSNPDGLYIVGEKMIPTHNTSVISQVYSAWELGRTPTENIALLSYSEDRSIDNSLRVRDIIMSKMFRQIFPSISLDKQQKAKTNFRIRVGGVPKAELYALGRNSPVTGRTFHKIIIDDIIKDANEVNSPAMRESVVRSMETIATRITNNTRIIIIGTRWFEGDPIGEFYKQAIADPARWLVVKYPAIALEDEPSIIDGEIWRRTGEPLLPEITNLEALARIKSSMSPMTWSSVYMQAPPTEEVHFRRSWIQTITKDELKKLRLRWFLTVDPAFSIKTSADRTGFCLGGLDEKAGKLYIIAWGERLDPRSLVKRLFEINDRYNLELIGIEKFAFTDGLKPFMDDQMKLRNEFLPIKQLSHNNRSKEARVIGALPGLYALGFIVHVEGECELLEQEMFAFPRGETDDVLDAETYMAIMVGGKIITTPSEAKVEYGVNWTNR